MLITLSIIPSVEPIKLVIKKNKTQHFFYLELLFHPTLK